MGEAALETEPCTATPDELPHRTPCTYCDLLAPDPGPEAAE